MRKVVMWNAFESLDQVKQSVGMVEVVSVMLLGRQASCSISDVSSLPLVAFGRSCSRLNWVSWWVLVGVVCICEELLWSSVSFTCSTPGGFGLWTCIRPGFFSPSHSSSKPMVDV